MIARAFPNERLRDPTPEEISEMTEAIRKAWTPKQRRAREPQLRYELRQIRECEISRPDWGDDYAPRWQGGKNLSKERG